MKRIKGRYVAQITVDFDMDASNARPLDQIQEDIRSGRLNREVQKEMVDLFGFPEAVVVDVQQMYADAYEVDILFPGGQDGTV